jgi:hypothetical protein
LVVLVFSITSIRPLLCSLAIHGGWRTILLSFNGSIHVSPPSSSISSPWISLLVHVWKILSHSNVTRLPSVTLCRISPSWDFSKIKWSDPSPDPVQSGSFMHLGFSLFWSSDQHVRCVYVGPTRTHQSDLPLNQPVWCATMQAFTFMESKSRLWLSPKYMALARIRWIKERGMAKTTWWVVLGRV